MSGGGKTEPTGSQTVTTTNKSEPWAGQQPYLSNLYGMAQDLFSNTGNWPRFYPGTTTAGFSPQQEMGMNLITGRALAGSPLTDSAQGQALNTIQGGFLNSNPYLDAMYKRATDPLMADINSVFGDSGRTASGAHAGAITEGLGDVAANIYGGNYQAERDRMQSMIGMAPWLAQSDYSDFDRLMGVGNTVQNQAQNMIGDQMNRFNYYQNLPEQMLGNYAQTVQGGGYPGGSSSGIQTSPLYGGNPLVNAAGGGMMGLGLMNGLNSAMGSGMAGSGLGMSLGPWGMAIPAGLAIAGGMK